MIPLPQILKFPSYSAWWKTFSYSNFLPTPVFPICKFVMNTVVF